MATLASNVYFPQTMKDEDIYTMTRRNVDILNAKRINEGKEEFGKIVLCIDDKEMEKVEEWVQKSKDYYTAIEDEVSLASTTIHVEALIVEEINHEA